MITTAIASFVLACLLSAALTALAIRLSPRIGLVDHPDQQRKLQAHPVPLGRRGRGFPGDGRRARRVGL